MGETSLAQTAGGNSHSTLRTTGVSGVMSIVHSYTKEDATRQSTQLGGGGGGGGGIALSSL